VAPRGRFELPRRKSPVVFETTALTRLGYLGVVEARIKYASLV
jgi:hypothetical protein